MRLLGDYGQFMPDKPPRQYLHGSRAAFRPGDTILPPGSNEWGRTTAPMMPGAERLADADDWVFLTTDLNGAWLYAYDSGGPGEPAVSSVIPTSGTMPDPEYAGSHMPAFRCRAAVVLSVDRNPPFSQDEAALQWIHQDPTPAIRPIPKSARGKERAPE